MAASDRLTGTAFVLNWTPSGGTLTAISADYTAFSMNEMVDTVDVTAGNETDRYHKPTLKDGDFSLTLFFSDQTYFDDLAPATEGVLNIRPEGSTAGNPEATMNALILTRNISIPFDGAIEVEITGRKQGDWTIEPFAAISS